MRDVILAIGACTDSGVNQSRFAGADFAAVADYHLLSTAVATAARLGTPVRVGSVVSGDLFYHPNPAVFERFAAMGVLAVEMEAAGIYGVAAEHGARALAICTVSDHLLTTEAMTSDERQTSITTMVELALETAVAL